MNELKQFLKNYILQGKRYIFVQRLELNLGFRLCWEQDHNSKSHFSIQRSNEQVLICMEIIP